METGSIVAEISYQNLVKFLFCLGGIISGGKMKRRRIREVLTSEEDYWTLAYVLRGDCAVSLDMHEAILSLINPDEHDEQLLNDAFRDGSVLLEDDDYRRISDFIQENFVFSEVPAKINLEATLAQAVHFSEGLVAILAATGLNEEKLSFRTGWPVVKIGKYKNGSEIPERGAANRGANGMPVMRGIKDRLVQLAQFDGFGHTGANFPPRDLSEFIVEASRPAEILPPANIPDPAEPDPPADATLSPVDMIKLSMNDMMKCLLVGRATIRSVARRISVDADVLADAMNGGIPELAMMQKLVGIQRWTSRNKSRVAALLEALYSQ